MPKAQVATPPIADLKPLEELEGILNEFVASINQQLEAEDPARQIEAKTSAIELAKTSLIKDSAERRDQIIAVIKKWETREAELRASVRVIETQARHWGAKAKSASSTIELAMIEMGLSEVNGILHRFKIYKSPDLLTVLNDKVIPARFFDESPNIEKVFTDLIEVVDFHKQPEEMRPCQCGAMGWPECRDREIKMTLLELIPVEKTLNKERLIAELSNPETDVPGAILETNRKRIDIK